MKTFKIRIHPNKSQLEFFEEQCKLTRWLYNDLLALFKLRPNFPLTYLPWEIELNCEKYPWSHFSLCKFISPLRKNGEKYDRLLSNSANVVCKDVSITIQEHFKRLKRGEPSDLKFRNYLDDNSFSIVTISPRLISKIDGGYIGLASPNVGGKRQKLGYVKFKDRGKFHENISKCPTSKIKQVKIVKDGKYWFACIVVDNYNDGIKSDLGVIGIDLGVTKPIVTSKEIYHDMPKKSIDYWRGRLNFYQNKLSKQVGGKGIKSSNRREKTKKHIQRCHRNIKHLRESWQHKMTHELTKSNHIICMEDLKTKNMTKSAKGDVEKHGKNIKAKSGLNREILNVGFYGIKSKLEYKSNNRGGQLIMVDPKHTSQECSECGHIDKENRKTQSKFKCVKCGHTENADFNASKNILKKGLTIQKSMA